MKVLASLSYSYRNSFYSLLTLSLSFMLLGCHPTPSDNLKKTDVQTTNQNEDFALIANESTIPDSVRNDSLESILDEILGINGPNMPAPPSTFRPGHAHLSDHKVTVTKTDYGYNVNMHSTSNIPTPAVYNGQVLVSGGFGSKSYFSLDAKTGDKKWSIALDDDGPSSPAIEDNVIVFNTESCTIFACDINTGEHLWSYFLGDPLMSMPTIHNGVVFTSYPANYPMNSGNGRAKNDQDQTIRPTHVIIAMELKTGKIVWQKWIDGDIMSAPVAEGDDLYFTTFPGTLYKIKQETGEIFSVQKARATSAPVLAGKDLTVTRRSDIAGEKASEAIYSFGFDGRTKQKYRQTEAQYLDKNVQDRSSLKEESDYFDAGNGFTGGAPVSSGALAAKANIGQSNVSSLQSFQGSSVAFPKNRTV